MSKSRRFLLLLILLAAILAGAFVGTYQPALAQSCPCTLWGGSATPSTPDAGDAGQINLGVKFKSSEDGYITGIGFYKASANTGTHVGDLWRSDGSNLAEVTFTGESSSGWQWQLYDSPVAITANTEYVASYFVPNGHYPADITQFGAAYTNGPLTAYRDGDVAGNNGVYLYASSPTFPTNSYNSSNYYVDIIFEETVGATATPTPTTAPTDTPPPGPTATPGPTNTPPSILITVVLVWPSFTPTLTPTDGPSPTPTGITEVRETVSGQDVIVDMHVTPGDAAIVGFLAILVGLKIAQLFRRKTQ